MDEKLSKSQKQVVRDEADATQREVAREKEKAIEVIAKAEREALAASTPEEAKRTFWQNVTRYFTEV